MDKNIEINCISNRAFKLFENTCIKFNKFLQNKKTLKN